MFERSRRVRARISRVLRNINLDCFPLSVRGQGGDLRERYKVYTGLHVRSSVIDGESVSSSCKSSSSPSTTSTTD